MRTKRAALVSVCATLLYWAGLGCTPKVDINGNSDAEIKVPKGFHIKWKNNGTQPIRITLPGGGSIEIPPGAEIEFDAGEGGVIKITDKIKLTNQTAQNVNSGTYDGTGTLLAGSTYAFTIPGLMGANQSDPMPLMGNLAFSARPDAAMPGPNGSKILNPAGIVSLVYHAGGPGPVWHLPLLGTIFGDVLGEGTAELEPYTVDYTGEHNRVSGVLDGDGTHYHVSFPIRLSIGDTEGVGMETEVGTATPADEDVPPQQMQPQSR